MAQRQAPAGLDDLPPSAKYIHKVLTYEGPLRYSEFDDVRCVPGTDARVRRYDVESER